MQTKNNEDRQNAREIKGIEDKPENQLKIEANKETEKNKIAKNKMTNTNPSYTIVLFGMDITPAALPVLSIFSEKFKLAYEASKTNAAYAKQQKAFQQISSERKKHTAPFVSQINDCIAYSEEHRAPLSCVLVDTKDKYSINDISVLLTEKFRANNGHIPSNELRRIGETTIGMLIHDYYNNVEDTLEKFAKEVKTELPVLQEGLRASVGHYEPGDSRSILLKKAQNNYKIFGNKEKNQAGGNYSSGEN